MPVQLHTGCSGWGSATALIHTAEGMFDLSAGVTVGRERPASAALIALRSFQEGVVEIDKFCDRLAIRRRSERVGIVNLSPSGRR